MGQITVELNTNKHRKGYIIPKGTKFNVDEYIFNQCKQFKRSLTVIYNNKEESLSSIYLDKITTPLEFSNKEDYVILECIEENSEVKLGSLHKVRRDAWENDRHVLSLSENVKHKGAYYKRRFKIYEPIIQSLLEKPLTPDEAFEDKQITIKCINNKGVGNSLTLNKTYTIYQSEWDKNEQYIISKFDTKEGVYNMCKTRFEIVSDECKGKKPFYNKAEIKLIQPLQFSDCFISINTKFIVDIKDWDSKYNTVNIEHHGKKRVVSKECFRIVSTFHEEADTFPSIPVITSIDKGEPQYGNIVSYGTGGEDKSNTWWGFDKSGEIIYTDEKSNPKPEPITLKDYYTLVYSSRNKASQRNKSFTEMVEEMSKYYNTSLVNEKRTPEEKAMQFGYMYGKDTKDLSNITDHEALHKRIAEIKYGKQLISDKVGISSQLLGSGLREQIKAVSNTDILWNNYPQQMIMHTARNLGKTNAQNWMDIFRQAFKEPKKDFLKNITIPKKIKQKKQIIVEPMNNIKL